MKEQAFEQRKEQVLGRLRNDLEMQLPRLEARAITAFGNLQTAIKEGSISNSIARQHLAVSLGLMQVEDIRYLLQKLIDDIETALNQEEAIRLYDRIEEETMQTIIGSYERGCQQGTYHRLWHEQDAEARKYFLDLLRISRNEMKRGC